MGNEYKYDVALSFTQTDEDLAFQLFNLLRERLNCFIYSERQKEIAGKNGEDVFNNVFGKESRIVVILYRSEWGNTKWTRIEQTAIRNRGYNEGYEFVLFVPIENKDDIPEWFPKNRLWIGLRKWGIKGAASVIEARFQESGGIIKERTIADIAAETERKIKESSQREERINFENFSIEFEKLKSLIEKQIKEIEESAEEWIIKITPNKYQGLNIYSNGYTLYYHWYQKYRFSLINTSLEFYLGDGRVDESGSYIDPFQNNTLIKKDKYYFHINEYDEVGWKSERKFYTSSKLIQYWLELFVKLIAEKRLKTKR